MSVFEITPALLDEDALRRASPEQLSATVWAIQDEQRRRAVENGDVDAITEEAFVWGFDKAGRARLPQLKDGVLVCPGAKLEKSATSHDCTYVSVEGSWVWEHPDITSDTQRSVTLGKTVRQSVTVIPAWEGMELDVVTSSGRNGPCRMKSVTSFQVRNGQLHATTTRSARPQSHR